MYIPSIIIYTVATHLLIVDINTHYIPRHVVIGCFKPICRFKLIESRKDVKMQGDRCVEFAKNLAEQAVKDGYGFASTFISTGSEVRHHIRILYLRICMNYAVYNFFIVVSNISIYMEINTVMLYCVVCMLFIPTITSLFNACVFAASFRIKVLPP